ncbi:MAG TPA: hypothetical protein VH092_19245 [Urbifossiella sp.]|nr:hypothetical protein [Urbifossiella sp.]
MSLLKWGFAALVLAVVLCAACDGKCAEVVALSGLEGLAAGLGHALVVVFCTLEKVRDPALITVRRVRKLVRHDARVGLISGLLIGVTYALVALLS